MQINQAIQRAYRAAHIPLWVTPGEIRQLLISRRYALDIAIELSDWIARRNSMCFAAGYLGHAAPVVKEEDVLRQLLKMKYVGQRAAEMASMIVDTAAGLYEKGCERRDMVVNWGESWGR